MKPRSYQTPYGELLILCGRPYLMVPDKPELGTRFPVKQSRTWAAIAIREGRKARHG